MSSQWTPDAIRALGATTDLPTLGSIFGVSRWRAYQMAHTGEWGKVGIRILPLGSKYRVTVQSILDVLSNDGTGGAGMRDQASPPS
jgi:predicted thioredoxin/glutaredoxin